MKSNDIFNARGDVFNARGDVFNASGNRNASGNVFNYSVSPLDGKSESEIMAMWRNGQISDAQYYEWLDAQNGSTDSTSQGGFEKWANNILTWADKSADVVNKFKSGTTNVEDEGINYEVEAGQNVKPDNKIWYIAGGVVVLLIGIGIYVSMKNKGK